MQQVADWLEKLGLGQYAQRFAENDITFAILPDLTDQDLKELGVASLGHRRQLLRAIVELGNAPTTPAPNAPRSYSPTPIAPPGEVAGERRYLTVMFCDLVGSTAISAQLDAEEWRDLVGAYLDTASAAVAEMGGHVAKKLGDGLMCRSAIRSHMRTTPSAQRGRLFRSSEPWPTSIAGMLEQPSQNSPPASALNPAPLCSTQAARCMATSPTLPPGCKRWPSPARSSSRRGCSVRSLGCLLRKSAARTRSKGCQNRPHCS